MSNVEDRLKALGLTLPQPVAPVANYVPFVRSGVMVHISGQVSVDAGGGIKGVVGQDLGLAEAQQAARLCGLNLIAQMKAATGPTISQWSSDMENDVGSLAGLNPRFRVIAIASAPVAGTPPLEVGPSAGLGH